MASITTNSTKGSSYTWDSSLYSWDSLTAEIKSVDDATIVNNAMNVIEDVIHVSSIDHREITLKRFISLNLSEQLFKKYYFVSKVDLKVAETYYDHINFILKIIEHLIVLEQEIKTPTNIYKENISVHDRVSNSPTKRIFSSVSFSDRLKNMPTKKSNEEITLSDLIKNSPLKQVNEKLKILDLVSKDSSILIKERLNIVAFYYDLITFILAFSEVCHITDEMLKDISIAKKDSLKIQERLKKDLLNKFFEEFELQEVYKTKTAFKRKFAENLHIIDRVAKNLGIKKKVAITLLESWLHNANAVISDIVISSKELAVNDFDSALVPAGYSSWKDFQVGDYTYKEALIKIILEASINSDRPYVEEWTMNVDVPDISDSGTAHCTTTNQPLTISFNKVFHVVPEVVAQIKSGATANTYLNITSVTTTGFSVELRDEGVFADGYISWSAEGY